MFRLLLIGTLFNSFCLFSQNCDNIFSGKVVDLHDGKVLIGAIIDAEGLNEQIITDSNGAFSISNLCNKFYVFEVSHPQCKTKIETIRVSQNINRILRLEHHIEELNEIIVYGNSFIEKSKTLIENKISSKVLEKSISSPLGEILSNLSGVSSFKTGNSVVKPVINGLHSSRVVIINNGVRMEDQEWGEEHSPNIDVNSLDKITLIKGAGALQYSGSALGGVIVAETSNFEVKDTLYGKILVKGETNGRGLTTTSNLIKTNENGLYSSVQVTFKRFGDFESPKYNLNNTGVEEQNASFRFGLNRFKYGLELYYSIFNNELGILRASHIGGAQDQIRAINSERPFIVNDFSYKINVPKQDLNHRTFRFKGFNRFKRLGKISFQYDYQQNNRLEFDIRRGDDKFKPSIDLELKTHSIKVDLKSQVSNLLNIKLGAIGRYQKNFPDPETGVRRIIPDYNKYDLGIYSIFDLKINDKFLLEAGGRFDFSSMDVSKYYRTSFWESRNYQDLFSDLIINEISSQTLIKTKLIFTNYSTTFGSRYNFDKNHSINFNYSIASRMPNPSELFSEGLHHSSARIELGDLRFNSEVGHKITLNYIFQNKNINLSVNPYINSINDFILIEPTSVQTTIRGNFQVWEYRQTNAQILGLDIDALVVLNKNFYLDNQLSIIKGRDLLKNEPLISMPPVNINNEIVYQNQKANNITLSLKSEYTFRQNEYPDNNFDVFVALSETTETLDLSTPPDAYQIFNFNSSIGIIIKQNYSLSLSFSIRNLFNKEYRNYLNRLRYYAHDLGRSFIFGANYKF
jgi:iron complex outermembrane receptor protein